MKSERQERFAQQYYENGKGYVYLGECTICGWLTWNSTQKNEPAGFSVTPLLYNCPKCIEVQQRNPELVRWILNVIAKQWEEATQ